jgi:4-carboxymuconolactone decarboxylase
VKIPDAYEEFKRTYPAVWQAYDRLGAAAHNAGPLDEKTRSLVKLGIAIGRGMEGATHAHVRLALSSGAAPDEVRHVVLLAVTTIGFPGMMAARSWVEEALSVSANTK